MQQSSACIFYFTCPVPPVPFTSTVNELAIIATQKHSARTALVFFNGLNMTSPVPAPIVIPALQKRLHCSSNKNIKKWDSQRVSWPLTVLRKCARVGWPQRDCFYTRRKEKKTALSCVRHFSYASLCTPLSCLRKNIIKRKKGKAVILRSWRTKFYHCSLRQYWCLRGFSTEEITLTTPFTCFLPKTLPQSEFKARLKRRQSRTHHQLHAKVIDKWYFMNKGNICTVFWKSYQQLDNVSSFPCFAAVYLRVHKNTVYTAK